MARFVAVTPALFRNIFRRQTPICENVNRTVCGRNCLLLYITGPFRKGVELVHQNQEQAVELARVIGHFGFDGDEAVLLPCAQVEDLEKILVELAGKDGNWIEREGRRGLEIVRRASEDILRQRAGVTHEPSSGH